MRGMECGCGVEFSNFDVLGLDLGCLRRPDLWYMQCALSQKRLKGADICWMVWFLMLMEGAFVDGESDVMGFVSGWHDWCRSVSKCGVA